ncbi:hypothetical protein GGR53DRAFT_98500 [Hypoxylon sp. FL1150]|nr:hypothetical protein GGR53DRAFT_98500 [Hypoxylon sp. FL1150]
MQYEIGKETGRAGVPGTFLGVRNVTLVWWDFYPQGIPLVILCSNQFANLGEAIWREWRCSSLGPCRRLINSANGCGRRFLPHAARTPVRTYYTNIGRD